VKNRKVSKKVRRKIGVISVYIGLIVLVFTYPLPERILRALGTDPIQLFSRSPTIYATLVIAIYIVFVAVFYFIGYFIAPLFA